MILQFFKDSWILGIEFVFCTVMLWLIFRHPKVIKFNVNIEPNLLFAAHRTPDSCAVQSTGFKFILGSAQEFPMDRDLALLNIVGRRREFPVSAKFLGWKGEEKAQTCAIACSQYLTLKASSDAAHENIAIWICEQTFEYPRMLSTGVGDPCRTAVYLRLLLALLFGLINRLPEL